MGIHADISITPKVHILTEHVPDFCKKHGYSLGWYSEQALESCHYDFLRNCWERGLQESIIRTSRVCTEIKGSCHCI